MSDAAAAACTACTASCAARAAFTGAAGLAQRVVDAHHCFPRRDLVGHGLVVLVDRAGDRTDVIAIQSLQCVDEPFELHRWVNGSPGRDD